MRNGIPFAINARTRACLFNRRVKHRGQGECRVKREQERSPSQRDASSHSGEEREDEAAAYSPCPGRIKQPST